MCGNDNRVHERPTQGYAGSTPSVLHTTEERGLSRPPGAHADKQNQEQAELEGIPFSTTFCGEHVPHLSEPRHSHIVRISTLLSFLFEMSHFSLGQVDATISLIMGQAHTGQI